MIDQRCPSQRSTSAYEDGPSDAPTAKQLVGLGHATPPKLAYSAPLGFGLAMTFQLVPFQCSIRLTVVPTGLRASPTAKQLEARGHATPLNPLGNEDGACGVRVTDQPSEAPASAAPTLTTPAATTNKPANVTHTRARTFTTSV